MKTYSSLFLAAATLAITAAAAPAQIMNADVPFAFRAGDSTFAPGSYRVIVKPENHLLVLSNYESKQTAMIIFTRSDLAKEWKAKGEPVMAFECGVGRCALASVWTGYENSTLTLPHRNAGRSDQPVLTLIRLVRIGRE
jgi:hypothetical protein